MGMRSICVWLLIAAAAPAFVRAEEQPPAPPTLDVGDLWRDFRNRGDKPEETSPATEQREQRRFLVVAPTVGSKPATGLTGGLNGNMAFFRGDPKTTRISTMQGGFRVSQKKQVLSGFRLSMFTADDRWYVQGDHRLQWTSQNTYGLGAATLKSGSENVKFTGVKVYETAYRNVAPGLFVGAGLNISSHSNVRPGDGLLPAWEESAYMAYSQEHGFSPAGQMSSGTTIGLLYDTRDNGINPQRGWLASSAYRTFYKGFLGGDSSWQELYLDLRTYRKITADGRHKLAFWAMSDLVTNGTAPYFDLPTTGGDGRSARGYSEGTLPRQSPRVRRGRVPRHAHEQRPARHGRLRQHDHPRQRRGRSKNLRDLGAGRRRGAARAAEQAIADEPRDGLRVGQGRLARVLSRDSGSVLIKPGLGASG